MPQAIPGVTSSSPPAQTRPGLRVVSNAELSAAQRDQDARAASARAKATDKEMPEDLGAFVRIRWQEFRNHRNQSNDPLNFRLVRCMNMFNGKYEPEKLHAIKRFGGSEVYSRLVAVKCRGATSLLRDVYLGAERPWDIEPQEDPPVPAEVRAHIMQLVSTEVQGLQQANQPVIDDQIHARIFGLMHAATQTARRNAMAQADAASDKIEDMLQAGNFYRAMTEFLIDLPLFPFACLKGPTVRMIPKLTWDKENKPSLELKPQMFWERISPFDLYWAPGASRIEEAEVIERKRLTRADLNDLLGLPGYNEDAIRAALEDYASGLREWLDSYDSERALGEGREDPNYNTSNYIDAIEYHGNVQGRFLLDQGIDPKLIPDLDRDYAVQTWVVGRHTIKTQLNPSPRQRHPYFLTSFEKAPGTVAGHGLPDLLEDIQEICNATLRALVNNMGMASGPQVVVNTDALSPTENEDELYPWKRWKVAPQDAMAPGGTEPITFFQPQSNAQELLQVYTSMSSLADDISAIPRYTTGESLSGGAGRTASGLSMLMGGAQKILQTVAANIDTDVLEPALSALYDMIMLTDSTGLLTGDEQIKVNGVNVALAKDTERQKQLQFLQITANPIDQPIVGVLGRARVLRAVASGMGLPDDIVPDDDTIQSQEQAKQRLQAAQLAVQNAAHPGGPSPGAPGGPPPGAPPSPAAAAAGSQPPQATPAQHSDNAPPVNNFQPPQGTQS